MSACRPVARLSALPGLRFLASVAVLSLLSSCTWLQDYGHCTATVTCENCEELKIDFEWVKDKDEREVDAP